MDEIVILTVEFLAFLGIVELHGGRIGASSDGEGKGSKFFVEIPLYAKEQSSAAPAVVLSNRTPEAGPKMKRRGRANDGSFLASASFLATDGLNRGTGAPDGSRMMSDAANAALMAVGYGTATGDDRASIRAAKSASSAAANAAADVASANAATGDDRPQPGPNGITIIHHKSTKKSTDPSQQGGAMDVLDANADDAPAQVEVEIRASKWESGLNFLVVDDSKPTRKVVRRLLSCHGHRATEAENGVDFIRVMEEAFAQNAANGMVDITSGYDVILMDDNMPEMNGPEAVSKIRARGYKGLIVGLTGHTLAEDIDYFKRMGATFVLSKPLNLDALKQAVCSALDDN